MLQKQKNVLLHLPKGEDKMNFFNSKFYDIMSIEKNIKVMLRNLTINIKNIEDLE